MTRITESQWVQYFGFQRFPFDRPEAGNEEFARPDFLASCFVPPACFPRILGQANALPVPSILFAARGTGKTACRVMVDYYCRSGRDPYSPPNDEPNHILSIPHIHLHRLLETNQTDKTSDIRAENHVVEILNRAMSPLVELIALSETIRETAQKLSPYDRLDLSWILFHYRSHLSLRQIYFLQSLKLWPYTNAQDRTMTDIDTLWQTRATVSPLDHLYQLAQWVRELGIRATYILVDGVDEFAEVAADPQQAYRLIRPLLTNLRLMDGTPYLTLKFFLPDFLEPFLQDDAAFRRDRGFIIEKIHWSKDDLIKILRQRLAATRDQPDRVISGFDALCVPELHGQIESDLATWANNNPRQLMVLCGLMVTAHCSSEITDQEDHYQLNSRDFQTALRQFTEQQAVSVTRPPSLRHRPPPSLADLIAQGEHEHLEFKASLQWSLDKDGKGFVNKEMRAIIGKAIVGMMNREGGTLLIGVADDGTILGLDNDLKALRKRNTDGFHLEINRVVETYLGLQYIPYIRVSFPVMNQKPICQIDIQPTPHPIYFRNSDNSYDFYVRLGNSTRKLDTKAGITYIQYHWSNSNDT